MIHSSLSVIIPCFNSSKTLEQSVSSCFRQGIEDLEIILVDDGSSDGTKELMTQLANTHPEIRLSFHETNKGGGAARNTGASLATSDTLFFLDSDDLLPDGTLRDMLVFLREKDADAVGIARSIKFKGEDINDVEVIHEFVRPGEQIMLDDLLERDGLCALYSTFMLSTSSFKRSEGYPTHHGFDTQAFAWRLLASGARAFTCPNVSYLHRIQFGKSYYVREANAGRVNFNWFDILDEHFFMLSAGMQTRLLHFNYRDVTVNVFDAIRSERGNLNLPGKNEYRAALLAREPDSLTANEQYWLGSEYLRLRDFRKARRQFELANRHRPSGVIREKIFLTDLYELGTASDVIQTLLTQYRRPVHRNSFSGILHRVSSKGRHIITSHPILRDYALASYHLYQDIAARIHSRHNVSLMINLFRLKLQKACRYGFPVSCSTQDPEEVDVVIPTLPKDRDMLVAYLSYLKKNLCEKIGTIYIVAPKNDSLESFCIEQNISFVDERSVLGYGKESIHYTVQGQDRAGWLFQQLLKLGSDTFVQGSRYVIVDSDTLLVRPHAFLEQGKTVFLESSEWQEPYLRAFETLFGYEAPNRCSFTCHMMIFTVSKLKEMKREIEKRSGKTWDAAYIDATDTTKASGISDYDTYANWLLHAYPEEVTMRPFYNRSFSRKQLHELDSLVDTYSDRYASFSFHSYNA